MTAALGSSGRLHLHVLALNVTAADLSAAVSRVLTGRAVQHAGVSAEVTDAWDGPELRLSCEDARAVAPGAGRLLREIAAAAGADRAAPEAGHEAGPEEDHIPYRAWQALMAHWQIADGARAEITTPGLLAGSAEAPVCSEEPVFVFDHVGPPVPPPGWRLLSWYAPDAGTYHCSVRPTPSGRRLKVGSPRPGERKRAAELLRAWQSVTTELAASPGLPLSALHVPPRRLVLGG
ncbi:hypothetical protein [Streptomyces purpurogeneiscleroticus]|uniref:hypothetical protein n=1 Tax=Streptomyces purpurogeneiscleroticus TaxID=68259 RepID=UPI001CBF524C|nr:hypothetical protein [Streptomyces purpurogeneiscleroticus]MBZ4017102.1 hypothetical protein [Streptomyces purpurogeneiscleroticus]